MADDKDYIKGWTIQQGPEPDAPESIPGNVVTYDELPYRESLRAAGIDEDQYLAGLVIAVDEEEKRAILGETERARGAEDKDEKVADAEKPARSAEAKEDAEAVAEKGRIADSPDVEGTEAEAAKAQNAEEKKDEAPKPRTSSRAKKSDDEK